MELQELLENAERSEKYYMKGPAFVSANISEIFDSLQQDSTKMCSNIKGFSGFLWCSIVLANGASYTWSSKHINNKCWLRFVTLFNAENQVCGDSKGVSYHEKEFLYCVFPVELLAYKAPMVWCCKLTMT